MRLEGLSQQAQSKKGLKIEDFYIPNSLIKRLRKRGKVQKVGVR